MGFFTFKRVQDADYLLRRAQEEAALAVAAKDPRVAEAHDLLASRYLDQIFGAEAKLEERGTGSRATDDVDVLKPIFDRLGQRLLAEQKREPKQQH